VSRRAVAVLAAVAAVATAYVFPGPTAQASAAPAPVESWVTNGDVHAVLTTGGQTYIAGAFDQVGPNTGFGVAVDSATGALPANFSTNGAKIDGHVYAATPDGKGGWFVGGDFTHVSVGGVQTSRHNGAEIKGDGTLGNWNPNTDLPIRSIVFDPVRLRVYAGGDFTQVKGATPANGLLVTNTVGSGALISFPAVGYGEEVDSLALSPDGSRLYVGGSFTTFGGISRSGLAAVDTATGTVDAAWNPSPDTAAATATVPAKAVEALATDGAGRVFVGGSFTHIGVPSAANSGFAVLSPSGTGALDGTWSVAADGPVESFAVSADRSRLYAGGGFATIGGQTRSRLALLSTAGPGAVDATFNPGADGDVLALGLSADGGRLYAGGAFSTVGGAARRFLAALDAASGTVDTGFDARAGGTVFAVSPLADGTQVFAGGEFTSVNGVPRHNVAALDANGQLVPGFVADTTGGATGGEVDALAADGGMLYLGGTFLKVNGTTETRLARVDAVTGAVDTSFHASPGAAVNALAVSGTRLFVGGAFGWINDPTVVRNNLASLNTAAGAVEGWNPNLDNNVADLALSPDQRTVYIAGTFAHVGSASRSFAAAVDAGTGLATSWKPAAAALVVKLAVSGDGGKVFLAERGTFKDGNRLQAWNTAGAGSLAWEHRADGDFQAVAVSSSFVYAGGHFTTVEGQAHLHLVSFDMGSGAIQSWPPFVSGGNAHGVFDIEVTPSTVTVAGDFERAGDADPANPLTIVAQGVARFPNSADPPPTSTTTTTGGSGGTTTTTQPTTTTTQPPAGGDPGAGAAAEQAGYWMVGSDGAVYNFGDAGQFGAAVPAAGSSAVDLEPTPSGRGYWIVTDAGVVTTRGDASFFGQPAAGSLARGETVTSISATPTGGGYWVFTSRGRVMNFGDAAFYGDMSNTRLNAPVLGSIPTTSGHGYYMVAADGGIFSFGDATFYGSMGDKKLNAPVESLVPTRDGLGYWLVASDGGIFAFGNAPFKGSMGGTRLNRPVTGMVRYADGYLMVGQDGGIFDFSAKPFLGSLGGHPPAHPIVSVAALG